VQLVLPFLDDAAARLWEFVPGTGKVTEWFRHDDPRLVRELVQHWVVRVLGAVDARVADA
jgi:hypothetical protein